MGSLLVMCLRGFIFKPVMYLVKEPSTLFILTNQGAFEEMCCKMCLTYEQCQLSCVTDVVLFPLSRPL